MPVKNAHSHDIKSVINQNKSKRVNQSISLHIYITLWATTSIYTFVIKIQIPNQFINNGNLNETKRKPRK